jgi:hypothetical protein
MRPANLKACGRLFVVAAALALLAVRSDAQETRRTTDPAGPSAPISSQAHPTSLDNAAWLAGRWTGEGLGGVMEEAWSPPRGGQMVGHFALYRDGAPVFYELMLIDVTPQGVRLRVKHVNPDGTAWEDKDAWTTFDPVSAGAGSLRWDALSLTQTGPDTMIGAIRIRERDGSVQEHALTFRRAPL